MQGCSFVFSCGSLRPHNFGQKRPSFLNFSEKVCQIRGEIWSSRIFMVLWAVFTGSAPTTCFAKLRPWTDATSQLTSKVNERIQPLAIKRIQQFVLLIVHLIKYPLSIILINFVGNEEMAAKTKWIRIFILCGTITVQTKYHRCQVPWLEVMYFCRCYWYFHLAGSLFWPPPTQSRPITFLCYHVTPVFVRWWCDDVSLPSAPHQSPSAFFRLSKRR